ncbi:MAG: endonuclease/exonuclease/phosphatase family protein [Chloroflexi bacterium]|nr:endonuclease/exonuclease/phosphatase family protein [Chloroflexota bacterium]
MPFRVATFNLHQGFREWEHRRELVLAQLGAMRPDILALNEVSLRNDNGRWLHQAARGRLGIPYAYLQQSKTESLSGVEAQGLLTLLPIVEAANYDYRIRNRAAQVVRQEIEGRLVDVWVTHMHSPGREESLRVYQVQQLLRWIDRRKDADAIIVCGDFNATLEDPSVQLMATRFQPTQRQPTALTPLHLRPDGDSRSQARNPDAFVPLTRCIDYIWVTGSLRVVESGRCFDQPDPQDETLWPSDHVGVWADLELL